MKLSDLDWTALERLRATFLEGRPAPGPYWASAADLASYDATFGERIGWKWDAVLREVAGRGWSPGPGVILDWGCGSGIAGRRVLQAFGPGEGNELVLWDHSAEAMLFAEESASRALPGIRVSAATPGYLASDGEISVLLLSHVLGELAPSDLEVVEGLARRSRSVLWVEPGTRELGRRLSAFRDRMCGPFGVVGPCTHAGLCPALSAGNERDWCHHFAPPPSEIFANSDWVKFGQRMGIDLRSLPYSFIALDRGWKSGPEGFSRVIGRPELFKPYARLLNCDAAGLDVLTAPKRTLPALYKELGRSKGPLVYRWARQGAQITSGSAL